MSNGQDKPESSTGCAQVSLEEQMQACLDHYEKVTLGREWNNQVPQAIRAWYAAKSAPASSSLALTENDEPLRELCFDYRNAATAHAENYFQRIVRWVKQQEVRSSFAPAATENQIDAVHRETLAEARAELALADKLDACKLIVVNYGSFSEFTGKCAVPSDLLGEVVATLRSEASSAIPHNEIAAPQERPLNTNGGRETGHIGPQSECQSARGEAPRVPAAAASSTPPAIACQDTPIAWAIYDECSDELIDVSLIEPENKSGIYIEALVPKRGSFSDKTPGVPPTRAMPICKDHIDADWNQPTLDDDSCILCRLFYLEAQEWLLEAAQQRAERAEDAIKDMERPLDAQMARLNAEVTRLNVENELLRSAASRSATANNEMARWDLVRRWLIQDGGITPIYIPGIHQARTVEDANAAVDRALEKLSAVDIGKAAR